MNQQENQILNPSENGSIENKQDEEGLINDLKDQDIENDDNISLDSIDKLANELNQINE